MDASFHWPRIKHALGKPLTLGRRQFRVRGYLTNNLFIGHSYEAHLTEPFRRAINSRSGALIDVGVNTGQTLVKVLSIDPKRRYLGFDPQVDCCFYVDQFLKDNKLRDHQIMCLALSDQNRLLPFYSGAHVDGFGSLVRSSPEHHRDVRYVPARIGDEVFEEIRLNDIGIIKVDVEGAEPQVFNGLRRTIAKHRPICFFEALPGLDTLAELKSIFDDFSYDIRQITADGSERVEFTDSSVDYVAY